MNDCDVFGKKQGLRFNLKMGRQKDLKEIKIITIIIIIKWWTNFWV